MLRKALYICILHSFFFGVAPSALRAIDVSVSYATFGSPTGSYIELYLYIVGSTVTFQPAEGDSTGALDASVEVVILFQQGEDIVKFDKFILNSPPAEGEVNFLDLKRYGLDDGTYTLSVSVQDTRNPSNIRQFSTGIELDYPAGELTQSDIQLLEMAGPDESGTSPLAKNGILMEPLPFNYYHWSSSLLRFYCEVYHSDIAIADDYMIRYTVDWMQGNDRSKRVIMGHKRLKPESVQPILIQHDISHLPSGNYNLTIEVRNRTNELLSSKSAFFTRSNPEADASESLLTAEDLQDAFVRELGAEELEYSLSALEAIIEQTETEILNAVTKSPDADAQRRFLYTYWARQSPNNPKEAYEAYMTVVRAVDDKYADGFGHGFQSDRGYIYLRYGQPDDIVRVDNDPTAPPYEIWIYYDFPKTRQANVKFLFYNPNLAANQYELLHSTARGELNNPRWRQDLYRLSPTQQSGPNPVESTGTQDNWLRHADRFFTDF